MQPLLVRYSRLYFIAQPLLVLAFATGAWQLLVVNKSPTRPDVVGGTLFGLLTVLTGWGLVGIVRRKPLIVLNDEGVFVAELAVGIISWPDVEQAFMHEAGLWQGGAELLLRNPEVYLRRRSWPRRVLTAVGVAFGKPAFGFETRLLDTSTEVVVAQIRQRLQR